MANPKPRSATASTAPTPLRLSDEITSTDIAGTTELAVVADLRQELVEIDTTMTHGTRLRYVLRTLHQLGKKRAEKEDDPVFPGPVEALRTIHHVRWTLFDSDQKMLMAVFFDSPIEPYIRLLVERAGPVLDLILCHCEGYRGEQGYQWFRDFLKRNQIRNEYQGGGEHGLTVDDKRYLRELDKLHRREPLTADLRSAAARLHLTAQGAAVGGQQGEPVSMTAAERTERAQERQLRAAGEALQLLAALYPLDALFPVGEQGSLNRRDRNILHRLVYKLLPGFSAKDIADGATRARFAAELQWFDDIETEWRSKSDGPLTGARRSEQHYPDLAHVQGGILRGYRGIEFGCLLLVRLGPPASARACLRALSGVHSAEQAERDFGPGSTGAKLARNLSLTWEGLRSLGLDEVALAQFPSEFRQGMAARAGHLVDRGHNHPDRWSRPVVNWPVKGPPDRPVIDLGSIDLVIQLRKRTRRHYPGLEQWNADHPLYGEIEAIAARVERHAGQLLRVEPLYNIWDRQSGEKPILREHFGFRDGISQPRVMHRNGGGAYCESDNPDYAAVGELLLGYPRTPGELPETDSDSLLFNGSFLVLRKLRQDVAAFEQVLAGQQGADPELVAAKLVGRYRDGQALAETGGLDNGNDFDFRGDEDGTRCPLESHIRRSNPRAGSRAGGERQDASRAPRIARRGMSWSSKNEQGEAVRGLMFMAYNARIAEQFEVLQRWIGGGNSTGRCSAHSDPLLGVWKDKQRRYFPWFDTASSPQLADLGEKPLVCLEWGMYLFTPSIPALEQLGQDRPASASLAAADSAAGEQLLQRLQLLDRVAAARAGQRSAEGAGSPSPAQAEADCVLRWKKVLEDPSARSARENLWAAIRERGGALRTPYGLLVASDELIDRIFRDRGESFSVREYLDRMEATTGPLHLGMDPSPNLINSEPWRSEGYQRAMQAQPADVDTGQSDKPVGNSKKPESRLRNQAEAPLTNEWIAQMRRDRCFADAHQLTLSWLENALPGSTPETLSGLVRIEVLVADVLGKLTERWFGLLPEQFRFGKSPGGWPGADEYDKGETGKPISPEVFTLAASCIFLPEPAPFLREKAQKQCKLAREAIAAQFSSTPQAGGPAQRAGSSGAAGAHSATLLDRLREQGVSEDDTVRMVAGSVMGFAAPTTGSLINLLKHWLDSGQFWRLQLELQHRRATHPEEDAYSRALEVMRVSLVSGMQRQPTPSLLHRTAVREDTLGPLSTLPGERVVLCLGSASLERLGGQISGQQKAGGQWLEADNTSMLFGGNFDPEVKGLQTHSHACPGKEMALGTMLGIASGLLDRTDRLERLGLLGISVNYPPE